MEIFSNSMENHSWEQLMLFQAASPASHSAKTESEGARMTLVTFGRKCIESLERLHQPTWLRKTLVDRGSFSMKYAPRWSLLGTKRNRVLLRLLASVRTTCGSGTGLFPTPRALEIING